MIDKSPVKWTLIPSRLIENIGNNVTDFYSTFSFLFQTQVFTNKIRMAKKNLRYSNERKVQICDWFKWCQPSVSYCEFTTWLQNVWFVPCDQIFNYRCLNLQFLDIIEKKSSSLVPFCLWPCFLFHVALDFKFAHTPSQMSVGWKVNIRKSNINPANWNRKDSPSHWLAKLRRCDSQILLYSCSLWKWQNPLPQTMSEPIAVSLS